MISLKTAYYYILAVKINFIKLSKKIYFTTGFYKKSLMSKVPNQFFFFPNPFFNVFLSRTIENLHFKLIISTLISFGIRITLIKKKELHNFLWLSSIDRKDDTHP